MSDVTVPRIGGKALKRVFHREPTDRVVGIVRVLVAVSIAVAIVMAWQRLHDASRCRFPRFSGRFSPLLFLHGLQLAFSAAAWSRLLAAAQTAPVSRRLLLRLRVIREGVDSILPVGADRRRAYCLVDRDALPVSLPPWRSRNHCRYVGRIPRPARLSCACLPAAFRATAPAGVADLAFAGRHRRADRCRLRHGAAFRNPQACRKLSSPTWRGTSRTFPPCALRVCTKP